MDRGEMDEARTPEAIHSAQQGGSWKDKISTTANKGEEEILKFLHNLGYVSYFWTSEDTQSQRKEQETCKI